MKKHGFVMIAAVSLLAVLASLLTAYFVLTNVETSVSQSSSGSTAGLYAAEAGLNIRAEQIRQAFVGYTRPTGTSPSSTNPCIGANLGTGAFVCINYTFQNRTVRTYVEEAAGNPLVVDPIPPGELYQGLSAQEYRYSVFSRAINSQNRPEAILEMRFRSRLVPMFQFAAFYNKDLEILPGRNMRLDGPVHTNGDLYLNSGETLEINGQITTAEDLYRGRKNDGSACNGTVNVLDPSNHTAINCGSGRTQVTNTSPWNGMIQTQVETLTVPEPDELDPSPGATYFNQADLRIVYNISVTPRVIEVRNSDNTVNSTATTALLACTGTVTNGANTNRAVGVGQFFNRRENRQIELLEIDVRGLLNCVHNNVATVGGGRALDDSTQGGLVWHFTVLGPNAGPTNSNYGVRLRNGSTLSSSVSGAPTIRGLTIVSDQALYVQGNFNGTYDGGTDSDGFPTVSSAFQADPQTDTSSWRPAAFLADSINILSNAWNNDQANAASCSSNGPDASNTVIQAAFLSGTDTTGGTEGTAGWGGAYNGGLENYPRLHEDWGSATLTYRGSFVSLNRPRNVNGSWGSQCYGVPTRDWRYDNRFDNAANLPPLSPRFVYLVQELFVRQFEQ